MKFRNDTRLRKDLGLGIHSKRFNEDKCAMIQSCSASQTCVIYEQHHRLTCRQDVNTKVASRY